MAVQTAIAAGMNNCLDIALVTVGRTVGITCQHCSMGLCTTSAVNCGSTVKFTCCTGMAPDTGVSCPICMVGSTGASFHPVILTGCYGIMTTSTADAGVDSALDI